MNNEKINMVNVESSNVKCVGYDEENRNIHVELLNGECYMYIGVPKKIFEDLLKAQSIGAYINRYLVGSYEVETKDSFYELTKAAEPLVAYLRKYHCPHDQVIVTQTFVKLTQDKMGVPFEI